MAAVGAVPVQMWQREHHLNGRVLSQLKGALNQNGSEPSAGADVGGGEPISGTDVGGVSPVLVQMWQA